MGAFNFKSSGKTQEQSIVEAIAKSTIPIGIATPLRLGEDGNIFAMHMALPDQVNDNFRNMLMTNWGERLGLYDFGANLRPLMSEFTTQENFDAVAVQRISQAVARWMPFISLEEFLSEIDNHENKNTAIVRLTITYTIPALQTGKRTLLVTMYAM